MNSCERIMTMFEGGKPDRTPVMIHSFMAAAEEAGITMSQYRSSAQNIADCHIRFAEKYNLDGILMDIDTCMEAGAIGIPVDFPENEPARAIGPLSSDIDVLLKAMRPEKLLQNERINISLEAVRLLRERVGNDLFIRGNCDQMGFSLAMLSYGMSDFMCDLLDEDLEEVIFELIGRATEVHLEYHRLMKQAGVHITSFGDSSCGPDLISRDCYLKFGLPFHKKLADSLNSENIKTMCHICGNLDNILEDVVGLGFPSIEIDYKTNIKRAAGIMESKCIMSGSVDPSGIFYFSKPQEVRTATLEVLDAFGGNNMIACSGCAISAGTPKENIRMFVETVKNYEIRG